MQAVNANLSPFRATKLVTNLAVGIFFTDDVNARIRVAIRPPVIE